MQIYCMWLLYSLGYLQESVRLRFPFFFSVWLWDRSSLVSREQPQLGLQPAGEGRVT